MKIPQKPPTWLSIDANLTEDRRNDLFAHKEGWVLADKYLHWNELKRRPSPKGFTHQEWWYVLKLARGGNYRPIGLLGKEGRPFVFGQRNTLTELLHEIDRGLGLAIGLPEAVAHPATRD